MVFSETSQESLVLVTCKSNFIRHSAMEASKASTVLRLGTLGRKTDRNSSKTEDKVQRRSPPGKVQRKSPPNSAQVEGPCDDNKGFLGRYLPPQSDPNRGPMEQNWELPRSHLSTWKEHAHWEARLYRRTCQSSDPTLSVKEAPPNQNVPYEPPAKRIEALVHLNSGLLLPWSIFR